MPESPILVSIHVFRSFLLCYVLCCSFYSDPLYVFAHFRRVDSDQVHDLVDLNLVKVLLSVIGCIPSVLINVQFHLLPYMLVMGSELWASFLLRMHSTAELLLYFTVHLKREGSCHK